MSDPRQITRRTTQPPPDPGSFNDWLGAWFTANRDANEVTVIARWRDADSYERLRAIDSYQGAKAQFAQKFVGPPDLSVNEVLVEM